MHRRMRFAERVNGHDVMHLVDILGPWEHAGDTQALIVEDVNDGSHYLAFPHELTPVSE